VGGSSPMPMAGEEWEWREGREDGGTGTRREGPRLAAATRSCEERLAFLGSYS